MILEFKPSLLTLGVFVTILQLFLYVNAPLIFPEPYVPKVQSIILLYMIVNFGFSFLYFYIPNIKAPLVPRDVTKPFWEQLIWFFVSFFIFASLLKAIPLPNSSHIFQIEQTLKIALPFMILFSFVVAYTEELVFRGILPRILTDIGSNILFGLFHFYAYQGNMYSILIAIIFGFIFSIIRDKLGLMGAVGMHTAWNLKIMGAF